jgi:hypothetical protein
MLRSLVAILPTSLLLVVSACGAPDPWRGCRLALVSGQAPLLQRQSDLVGEPALSAPHCAPQPTSNGLPDEPEAVDDLDALLDRGSVCGPDGKAHVQHACSNLAAHGLRVGSGPTALQTPPTCGAGSAACPNQRLVLTRTNDAAIELEFYDDPSSHRPPASASCMKPADVKPCYYRLGRVSTLVRL